MHVLGLGTLVTKHFNSRCVRTVWKTEAANARVDYSVTLLNGTK